MPRSEASVGHRVTAETSLLRQRLLDPGTTGTLPSHLGDPLGAQRALD